MKKQFPDIPQDYIGLFLDYHTNRKGEKKMRGAYWSYGKGYYRDFPAGKMVYKRGKFKGYLPSFYPKLRRLTVRILADQSPS